jgi:hypothetical protein
MPSVRSPARMSGLPHRTEGGQLSATASCAKRPNSKNASRRHHFRPFEPPLKTSLLGVVLQTHAPNHARERERQEEGGGSKPSVDSEKPWSTDRPRDGPPVAMSPRRLRPRQHRGRPSCRPPPSRRRLVRSISPRLIRSISHPSLRASCPPFR